MRAAWPADLLMQDFRDRKILITGSSRGIGAAVARAFAELGAKIVLHGREETAGLRDLAADIGATATHRPSIVTGNFADSEATRRAVDQAIAQLGGLDILINNAGTMMGRHPAAGLAEAVLDEILSLNAKSVVTAAQQAFPALRKSSAAAIVNTTSISARSGGSAGSLAYSGAKAFVSTATRSLATEWAGDGIRVNAVSPGTIDTDFHRRYSSPEKLAATAARIPQKRLGQAEDCVGAYLFLASHSLAGYITGQVIEVNGGALMP
ncbi:SDR family NAD(P)-dependent oxidoreductase [Dongia soli]|uniref:SDR family oxidoreductase n=1 Tax=Dongia soli TaxID=600628 RepID=A0ABU5E6C1_9PROT|nr:SDR family oxidoreductase [Dongia soli]MDY0881832.1 SDR family oxidoreductase [Dongia soli]